MAKPSLVSLQVKIHALLAPLSAEDRARVIQATFILLGEDVPAELPAQKSAASRDSQIDKKNPQDFFKDKDPRNKGELYAVAARFRELNLEQEVHSKADIKQIVAAARRNFDDGNYARDMQNARRQAGLFNLGTGRDGDKLSYYGQQYVDALPDRDAVAGIKRPKSTNRKKSAAKNKK